MLHVYMYVRIYQLHAHRVPMRGYEAVTGTPDLYPCEILQLTAKTWRFHMSRWPVINVPGTSGFHVWIWGPHRHPWSIPLWDTATNRQNMAVSHVGWPVINVPGTSGSHVWIWGPHRHPWSIPLWDTATNRQNMAVSHVWWPVINVPGTSGSHVLIRGPHRPPDLYPCEILQLTAKTWWFHMSDDLWSMFLAHRAPCVWIRGPHRHPWSTPLWDTATNR